MKNWAPPGQVDLGPDAELGRYHCWMGGAFHRPWGCRLHCCPGPQPAARKCRWATLFSASFSTCRASLGVFDWEHPWKCCEWMRANIKHSWKDMGKALRFLALAHGYDWSLRCMGIDP